MTIHHYTLTWQGIEISIRHDDIAKVSYFDHRNEERRRRYPTVATNDA